VVLRKGPHMSRMGDLYIDISEKLEKKNKEFAAMIDCGCESCETQTIVMIDAEFKATAGSWHNS
jgi:hypothetical protein